MYRVICLAFLTLAACKHDERFTDGGPPGDAHQADAGVALDAAPPAPGREITTGAGHMTSAHYSVDVQVGHGVSQAPTTSPSYSVQGNSPVKP